MGFTRHTPERNTNRITIVPSSRRAGVRQRVRTRPDAQPPGTQPRPSAGQVRRTQYTKTQQRVELARIAELAKALDDGAATSGKGKSKKEAAQ